MPDLVMSFLLGVILGGCGVGVSWIAWSEARQLPRLPPRASLPPARALRIARARRLDIRPALARGFDKERT